MRGTEKVFCPKGKILFFQLMWTHNTTVRNSIYAGTQGLDSIQKDWIIEKKTDNHQNNWVLKKPRQLIHEFKKQEENHFKFYSQVPKNLMLYWYNIWYWKNIENLDEFVNFPQLPDCITHTLFISATSTWFRVASLL